MSDDDSVPLAVVAVPVAVAVLDRLDVSVSLSVPVVDRDADGESVTLPVSESDVVRVPERDRDTVMVPVAVLEAVREPDAVAVSVYVPLRLRDTDSDKLPVPVGEGEVPVAVADRVSESDAEDDRLADGVTVADDSVGDKDHESDGDGVRVAVCGSVCVAESDSDCVREPLGVGVTDPVTVLVGVMTSMRVVMVAVSFFVGSYGSAHVPRSSITTTSRSIPVPLLYPMICTLLIAVVRLTMGPLRVRLAPGMDGVAVTPIGRLDGRMKSLPRCEPSRIVNLTSYPAVPRSPSTSSTV